MTTGKRLAEVCRSRGLLLLAGADSKLAEAIGADGVHLPERLWRESLRLRARFPGWVVTASAHSRSSLRRLDRSCLNAAFVSPVFASDSPSATTSIGPRQLTRWVEGVALPVYALGGVDAFTISALRRTGVAGVAAVGALAD